MPDVITSRQFSLQHLNKSNEQTTDIRAQIVSLGGTIVLAATILITLVLILSFILPKADGLQLLIIILLTLISWGFFLNCTTEHLIVSDGVLAFSSLLGRSYKFPLNEIVSYKITDLGVQMNGDSFLLEVELIDKDKPVEIGLGPCWKRYEIKKFFMTLDEMFDEMYQDNNSE